MSDSHPLQRTWVLWQHVSKDDDKNELIEEVCEFNTVEDFWSNFNWISKPSEVFYDGFGRKEEQGKYIIALSLL